MRDVRTPMVVSGSESAEPSAGPVGAALVVGGGVAGMQAALDLANGGYRVYLVDRATAIGGTMAQLDKTFPTNDCAMCIMSPRLVELGRHLDVEVLTGAELVDLAGEPGRFVARVRQRARYVDVARCTGCGDCAAVCPVEMPDAFNGGLARRRAIHRLYPQGVPNAFAVDKRGPSPCRHACPAGQRVPGYVALVRARRFADALRVIREENPFPGVCGRVCHHRCEEACSRGQVDRAVAICALKRFVADRVYAETPAPAPGSLAPAEWRAERVAVVGAGPAGLTAAHDLALRGYRVTVFEALPVAGGMLRVGVPEFRLPRALLEREVAEVLARGVELRTGVQVDDLSALLEEGPAVGSNAGYDAVFLAVGAPRGRKLPIPGADHPDALVATELLRRVSLGESVPAVAPGRRVLVLGGGNVALDAARTARRLGAEVVLACLESREAMPASRAEVAAAAAEGVAIHPGRSFVRVLVGPGAGAAGPIVGVECVEVASVSFDAAGRLSLTTRPGTEHTLAADAVVFAIGQAPDPTFLRQRAPAGLALDRRGLVAADPETLQTGHPAIFAGGDAVTGTTWAIEAIAAGHRAARSIDRYLRGEPLRQPGDARPAPVELSRAEALGRIAAGLARPPEAPAAADAGGESEPPPLAAEAAVAEAERCLACGGCSECLECVRACQRGAVDHAQSETTRELAVGAVVLALGAQPVDPRVRRELGYSHYANVVTSLQFERMLSASGPSGGRLYRPSDGLPPTEAGPGDESHPVPRRIAFVQCVGSRDVTCGRGYCSAVCCMYVAKEAVIAREHAPEVEPTVFHLDVRASGKGCERYCEAARRDHGVRYVRSLVSSVREVPGSRRLRVRYADAAGRPQEEEFDLVVLAVGLEPPAGSCELAERLGVRLDAHGFPELDPAGPPATSRPGVFAAGGFAGPKDIPSAVVEGSAAAAAVGRLLAPARGTLTRRRDYPPERDVADEEARVGVFVCRCGANIAGTVDVAAVVERARGLPGVVHAEENLYTCSQDTQQRILERIGELGLNRVIVASCTPRTHEPLFQETLREAGLNPHLFEMVNLREQDAWVHRGQRAAATAKAQALVQMAAARARLLQPVRRQRFDLVAEALVLGGGLAGLTAALTLADQGFRTCLVEREAELGGHLRRLRFALGAAQPPALLAELVARVERQPGIRVLTRATLRELAGRVGRYTTTLAVGASPLEPLEPAERVETVVVTHGALVVATGARAARPTGYLYGEDPRVLSQVELEEALAGPSPRLGEAAPPVRSVVMLQCVGSRTPERPYCSKVCCPQAIKNALRLRALAPAAQVYVLHRDVRTGGLLEEHYRAAREAGVRFLRYEPERPPEVRRRGAGLEVAVELAGRAEPLRLAADLVVLSAGVAPGENADLASRLKLPLGEDGFFLEAHAKLRPLDFAAEGVFLCGLAHSPQTIPETIAQAAGAAARAAALLSRSSLESAGAVATVDERRCTGCGLCVAACAYGARRLDPESGVARVEEVLCQGCGACAVACPSGATRQLTLERRQMMAMLEALTP